MSLTTPNGKEIQILNKEGTGHFKVQFTSGGELPESLSGLYTSVANAKKEVIHYIKTLEAKQKKNTKEE